MHLSLSLPYRIIIVAALLGLVGCETLNEYTPAWMGDSHEDKLEGTRIAVLEEEKFLQVDDAIMRKPMTLPAPQINTRWLKSSGFQAGLPEHIQGPYQFSKHDSFSIGDDAHYNTKLRIAPLILDKVMVTLDGRGVLSARLLEDPDKKLWKVSLSKKKSRPNFALAGFVLSGDTIYATSGGHDIFAINRNNGTIRWSKSITGIARSAPSVGSKMVYVNTLENKIYALSTSDGTIIWTHEGIKESIGTEGIASPVVAGNAVYAAYSSGEIYALKADTGKTIWVDALLSGYSRGNFVLADLDASPVIKDGMLYTSSHDGIFAAIDIRTGFRVWEQNLASRTKSWVAGDHLFVLSLQDQLLCIERSSGRIRWERKLDSFTNKSNKKGRISWSAPILVGGNLLLANSRGQMLQVSPYNGEITKRQSISDDIFCPIVAAGNSIYMIDNDADLHVYTGKAFNPSTDHHTPTSSTTKASKSQNDGSVPAKDSFFDDSWKAIKGVF